jgi:hypothetical protein
VVQPAVRGRDNPAPAASVLPELLHGDENRFSPELVQLGSDGMAANRRRLLRRLCPQRGWQNKQCDQEADCEAVFHGRIFLHN